MKCAELQTTVAYLSEKVTPLKQELQQTKTDLMRERHKNDEARTALQAEQVRSGQLKVAHDSYLEKLREQLKSVAAPHQLLNEQNAMLGEEYRSHAVEMWHKY